MSALKLSLRLLWRGAGGRSAGMLLFSLIIAVAVVACLTLTTDRLQRLIYNQASSFLAADAKVSGSVVIENEWFEQARELGLQPSNSMGFRAMLFGDDSAMQLGAVKAVDSSYPLKGELLVASEPYGEAVAAHKGPGTGEVWLTSRLFSSLKIAVGDVIAMGDAEFTVTRALIQEPDNPQSVMGFAPRALISIADVERTGAVALGSRVNYGFSVAGDLAKVGVFKEWAEPKLGQHLRWQAAGEGDGPDAGIFQRITSYVLLVGSLALVLGAVAIALAADEFAKGQHKNVALLKTLGLGPKAILRVFSMQITALIVAGCTLGLALGWLFQAGLLLILSELIPHALPAPALLAWLLPIAAGSIVLLAFAGPRFLALRKVLPISALRHMDIEQPHKFSWLLGAGVIVALVALLSGEPKITGMAAVGLLLAFYSVRLLVFMLMVPLAKLQQRTQGAVRLGLGQWLNYRKPNATQATVFGLIFMTLFSVYSARTQLLSAWEQQVPEGAPNHFVFNIFEHQKTGVSELIAQHSTNVSDYYPMSRGRVTAVNGEPWQQVLEQAEHKNNMDYQRELNLTWSQTLQADNTLVAGEWWPAESNEVLISIEQEYAKGAGLAIGDTVTLSLTGQEVTAKIHNIRTLNWQSMRPNFFIIFNRQPLEFVATNWISSFYLAPEQKPVVNELVQKYPSITLIEVDQTLDTLKTLIAQLGMAVEYLLVLMSIAALAVLLASVFVTLPTRLRAAALMRAFGAATFKVRNALWVEFALLGLLAGLVACMGSELLIRFWLADALELEHLGWLSIWWWGIPVSIAVLGIVGALATRKVFVTPPSLLLRNV